MEKFIRSMMLTCLTIIFCWFSTLAQSSDDIIITLSRDFGYSSGKGDIQGTFSIKAQTPSDVVRVVYYIDDQVIGESETSPFKLQFSTDAFPLGAHTISATAYTADGKELKSKAVQRIFVSAEEGWKAAGTIAIPILSLTFGIILLSFLFPLISGKKKHPPLPLGTPRNYGWSGGTICPKCKRPFSIHFSSLKLGFSRLDWCPHCFKWSFVTRYSLEKLRTAEKDELDSAGGAPENMGLSEEEKLAKEINDSKFQDTSG